MNDAYYSYATLNGLRNTIAEHTLTIGLTNTFDLYSYLNSGLAKTNGNDLFIARFLAEDGSEV
jgi:hypothetical protein